MTQDTAPHVEADRIELVGEASEAWRRILRPECQAAITGVIENMTGTCPLSAEAVKDEVLRVVSLYICR